MSEYIQLNASHDPNLRSWIHAANEPDCDFPIQNLPFGVFDDGGGARGGVAIGDRIVDLRKVVSSDLLAGLSPDVRSAAVAAAEPDLTRLVSLESSAVSGLRNTLSMLLSDPVYEALGMGEALMPMRAARMCLPLRPPSFTDAMLSLHHIRRATQRRDGNAAIPRCFEHLPIAYNGRASTVQPSGAAIVRPHGQKRITDSCITFGPSSAMDFELEVGIVLRGGRDDGKPIMIEQARDYIFGLCLLNDWSARDIQRWESAPLGPLLGKSFATTISPWLVTTEALRPFTCPQAARPLGSPSVLPYLLDSHDQRCGGYSIKLEAYIQTTLMREKFIPAKKIVSTSTSELYWTISQIVAHISSNGCVLLPGELIGTGTCSGEQQSSAACLAEITGGSDPLEIEGDVRLWLEDGDEVIFHGRAERDGFRAIGFGECRGQLLPAMDYFGADPAEGRSVQP